MTTRTVSVQVPEPIFRKLKRAADVTCRPVEEVLAATLNAALPEPSGLPPELADELASMHLFSDDALWAAVEPSLSPTEQRRLGQLNRFAGQFRAYFDVAIGIAEAANSRAETEQMVKSLTSVWPTIRRKERRIPPDTFLYQVAARIGCKKLLLT